MKRQRQSGFTLIELLVALLILSAGLLGYATTQVVGLRTSQGAEMRTRAIQLASEISDCMRANISAVEDGSYNLGLNDDLGDEVPDCAKNACTAAEMAAYDLNEWRASLIADLPSGQGSITANGGEFTIRLHWDESRSGATGTSCPPNDDTDLRCIEYLLSL